MHSKGGFLLLACLSLLQFCSHESKSLRSTSDLGRTNLLQAQRPIRDCGLDGFTLAEEEHIIEEIERPFVVSSIRGEITNDQGGWPAGQKLLFELRGMAKDSKVLHTEADRVGNFVLKGIPDGKYCFKVTADGWRSVMGVIFVHKKTNPKEIIVIHLLLGV